MNKNQRLQIKRRSIEKINDHNNEKPEVSHSANFQKKKKKNSFFLKQL